ncbi:MAG: MFS transporter [Oscillatoriales cyanobacterium RM2_1_1]|nr:MFS transporter [Oscillatoriales cyanobacterium SM2_3_0]NJO44407.1 MFS transporter [Oscillatoriales cyanobacterium RM2_1_1]
MPNPNTWITKLTLLLASSLTVMAGATVAPALPAMSKHFAEEIANPDVLATLVKLIITMPALFIVIGSPIAGFVVDAVGRKFLLLSATVAYGLAGCSGLFLRDLTGILVGRACLGLAVAGVMVSATTLIADYYTGSDRAAFMGLQAGFMGLGGVVFLTLGGVLAQQSWRFPFFIYLFAWLIVPMIARFITEPNRQLLMDENLSANPPFQPLPVAVLVIIYGLTVISQVAFYLIPVQLPFFLENLFQAQPTQSGMAIALCTLFSAIASVNYGRLKRRINYVGFLPIMLGLMGIGYLIIGQSSTWAQVLVGLVIFGMGLGILMPNMNVWISNAVSDRFRGRALSGISTSLFLGQFLSPLVSQPIARSFGLGAVYVITGIGLTCLALLFAVLKSKVRYLTVNR